MTVLATRSSWFTDSRCIINNLPVEILLTIFQSAYLPHWPRDNTHHVDNRLLQTLLAVCRHWREILIRDPRVWCRFSLFMIHGTYPFHPEMTRAWLSRSGMLPLHIEITEPLHGDQPSLLPQDFLDILIPFSQRWHRLDLELPIGHLLRFFTPRFSSQITSLPQLESLHIRFSEDVIDKFYELIVPGFDVVTTFANAPNLKTVSLSSVHAPMLLIDSVVLPWNQLVELRLCNILSKDVLFPLKTLEACPQLEVAFLTLPYSRHLDELQVVGYGLPEGSFPYLVCPKLKRLELVCRGKRGVSFVLSRITCPALEHLDFTHSVWQSYYQDGEIISALNGFHSRSRFKLRCLRLRAISNVLTQNLMDFVYRSSNSTLEVLDVSDCEETDMTRLVQLLYAGVGDVDSILAPNLTSLTFSGEYDLAGKVACIADLVASRGWADRKQKNPEVADLIDVHLNLSGDGLTKESEAILRSLRGEEIEEDGYLIPTGLDICWDCSVEVDSDSEDTPDI
ncbi:hypothetical protein VKT23_004924 [Stygiomarasmius scandens]|uniref:F-box domain-containing protein n=1 Tax=Marasmiellus scandens TaxID=2682957 RepID=A0ABR1JUX3_9AGAR